MMDPPVNETREKEIDGKKVIQNISPVLNENSSSIDLNYGIIIDDDIHFEEKLTLYLWAQQELEELMSRAGLTNPQWWDYRRFLKKPTRPAGKYG